MNFSFLLMLMVESLPSCVLMYFIFWLAFWGKSYRRKIRHAWLAHIISGVLTTAIVATIVFVLGPTALQSTSPIKLFLLPGLTSLVVIPGVFEQFRKKFPLSE